MEKISSKDSKKICKQMRFLTAPIISANPHVFKKINKASKSPQR